MRWTTAVFVSLFVLTRAFAAPQFGDYEAKGFLSDYGRLQPVGDGSGAFRYLAPEAVLASYDKLIIDRIRIFFKEDAAYKGIDPTELKALTDYFHQAIVKAVADTYPVVDKPGPGVLHLRIAVTDLVPNKPSASVVSLAVPFLWVGEAGAGAAQRDVGATPFTGEATVEMEALDSRTGRQLAAYIETRIGKKYTWTQGLEKGVTDYLHAYSTWAYTKDAMDHWARRIRRRLDAVHKRPAPAEKAAAEASPPQSGFPFE